MNVLIDDLDAHSGAVIALATVTYTVVTLLLLLEARSARLAARQADLDAYPLPWPRASMYLAVRLVNNGPAAARDVRLRYWFEKDRKEITASRREHGETVMPAAGHRTFLPDSTVAARATMLDELASMSLTLQLEWSWSAQGLIGRWRRREGRRSVEVAELRTIFYGGSALVERDLDASVDRLADEATEINKTLSKLDSRLDRADVAELLARRAARRDKERALARAQTVRPEGSPESAVPVMEADAKGTSSASGDLEEE